MTSQSRELVREGVSGWGAPPEPYFLEYQDDALYAQELARVGGMTSGIDPSHIYDYRGFPSAAAARRWWKGQSIQAGKITKVVNLCNITEPEDWPLTRWEWDEELIEER